MPPCYTRGNLLMTLNYIEPCAIPSIKDVRFEGEASDRSKKWTTENAGNESVPIQLAQCRFSGLAINSDKIQIYFSNKIHASNFFKQHSETVSLLRFETTKMLSGLKKINLLCYLL